MMSMTRERVRRLASAAILAAALSTIAAAPAAAFGPACSTPPMTQAYSAWGDPSWYTLAPGQTAGDFNGNGWILLGGARIVSTQLDDGTTGHVLDLPGRITGDQPAVLRRPDLPHRPGHDAQRRRTGQRLAVLHLRLGPYRSQQRLRRLDWNPTRRSTSIRARPAGGNSPSSGSSPDWAAATSRSTTSTSTPTPGDN